jgi:hypothetical protein
MTRACLLVAGLALALPATAQPYAWFPTNDRSTLTVRHPSAMEILNLATGFHSVVEVPNGVVLGGAAFDPATGRVLVITAWGTGQFQASPPALLPQVLPWFGDALFLSPDGRFAYVCQRLASLFDCQLRRRSDDAHIGGYSGVDAVRFAPDGTHLVSTPATAQSPVLLRAFSAADPLRLMWSRTFSDSVSIIVSGAHVVVARSPSGATPVTLSRIDPATGQDVVSTEISPGGSVAGGGGRVFVMTWGGLWPFQTARIRSFDGVTLQMIADKDPAVSVTKTVIQGFEATPDGRGIIIRLFGGINTTGVSLLDGKMLEALGTGAGWTGFSGTAVVPPEPWCVMTVSPSTLSLPVEGGVVDFSASVSDNCGAWGVSRPGDNAFIDSQPVRTGPATVRLTVGANTAPSPQTHWVNIGPSIFTVWVAAETRVPESPRLAGVRVQGARATVTWAPALNGAYPVSGFTVEGGVAGGPVLQQIGSTAASRSLELPALPPGTYFVQVRGRNRVGTGSPSAEATFTIWPNAAPQPPTGLIADVRGTTASLAWAAAASGPAPAHFVVEAAVDGGPFGDVGRTPDSRTEFVVGGVPAGRLQVRVRAANDAGTSAPTAAVPITVAACSAPPGQPGPVRVIATGLLTSLAWDAPASGADRYVLEGDGPLSQAGARFSFTTSSAATSLDVSAPVDAYRVRVRGQNACGVGPPSAEVLVLVPYTSPF